MEDDSFIHMTLDQLYEYCTEYGIDSNSLGGNDDFMADHVLHYDLASFSQGGSSIHLPPKPSRVGTSKDEPCRSKEKFDVVEKNVNIKHDLELANIAVKCK